MAGIKIFARSFRNVFVRAVFALTIFLSILCGTELRAEQPDKDTAGEAVYTNRCAGCHGARGVGTKTGPPLVHKVYHSNHHGDFSFHLAVRQGVRAHHWKFGNMEKVEGVSKEEVDKIVEYIRALQREAGIY